MRSKLLALIILLQSSSLLFAQDKGFYMRAGMGYAFPLGGELTDNTGFPYNGSITNSGGDMIYSMKNASFSSGLQGEIGLGYMFNKYIGIQLDINIGLANTKYTGSQINVLIDSIPSDINVVQYLKVPVLLIPSVVVQNGGNVFNVYGRFGIAMPISTKITQDVQFATEPGNGSIQTQEEIWELKNSFSIGLAAAFGVQYQLGNNMSIWAEMNLLSMTLYPQQANLTSLSQNGSSIPLSAVSSTSQVVTYGNNITIPNGNTGNIQPGYGIPFSSIGVHIGMSLKFPHHNYNKGRNETPKHYRR